MVHSSADFYYYILFKKKHQETPIAHLDKGKNPYSIIVYACGVAVTDWRLKFDIQYYYDIYVVSWRRALFFS